MEVGERNSGQTQGGRSKSNYSRVQNRLLTVNSIITDTIIITRGLRGFEPVQGERHQNLLEFVCQSRDDGRALPYQTLDPEQYLLVEPQSTAHWTGSDMQIPDIHSHIVVLVQDLVAAVMIEITVA